MAQTFTENGKTYAKNAYGESINVGWYAKNIASVKPTKVDYDGANTGYVNIEIAFRFTDYKLNTHVWFDIYQGDTHIQPGEDIFSDYSGRDILCDYLLYSGYFADIQEAVLQELDTPTIEHTRSYQH